MNGKRSFWAVAALFGAITLTAAAWLLMREVPSCGAPPLQAPMLDFEFAASRGDFAALLDCAPRLAELDMQNRIDLGLFMWSFGALLLGFALAVGVRPWLAVALAAVAVGADVVETLALRRIAADWPALDATVVAPLTIAVRIKYAAVGAAMLVAGQRLWRGGFGRRLAAALTMLGGAGAAAVILPEGRIAGSLLTLLAWAAMTGFAAVSALRSPRPAPSSPAA